MEYFDVNLDLTNEDLALKAAANKFAREVMRPVAKKLDEMTPEAAIAENSPLWTFLRKAYELGYHRMLLPAQVGGMGLNPLQANIVTEELGWGSFGLGVQIAVCSFTAMGAAITGSEELIREFTIPFCECTDGSLRGCWGATEPDHGSDIIGMGEPIFYDPKVRCNCTAKRDGDEWVINGQKSAWVSGGTISTHCLLHVQTDPSKGMAGWSVIVVPMDLPGVSKGKPLNKIGQRDLNQGELFFQDVRVPAKNLVVGPDLYESVMEGFLTNANVWMASWATGLARAAFEEAFDYCKERVQGGRLLMEHYSIKQRIFEMFARVETCRALTRAAANLNFNIAPGFPEYSMAAKTTATQMCLENANDAIQLLGGNGLSKEYLPEKLFRDARASLIEDGNNEILARHGGHTLFRTYPRSRSSISRVG
jgi:alkylation response protein AidB-like acyl-CoA dehydrogenase